MTYRLTPSVTDRLLIMYGILLQCLFLCYNSCVVNNRIYLYGWCEHLFVSELHNEYFTRQIFKTVFWVAKSYTAICSIQLLFEHCDFLNIDISQGSVATYLRCSGILNIRLLQIYYIICQRKNFKNRLTFGEVMTYGQEFSVLFFDSQCT